MNDKSVVELIELAKREDLGSGDVSTSLITAPEEPATFRLLAHQPGIFAGGEVARTALHAYDPSIEIHWTDAGVDGRAFDVVPVELAAIQGPLGALLSAERVLLNFLQRLCGVATRTRAFVDAVQETQAEIYDTRKTTPGWRVLEKYAVRCGGGRNHRMGLFDGVLIKDNHLTGIATKRLAGAVFDLLNRLDRDRVKPAFVEIEADTLAQLKELLKVVGIDAILLDNFSCDELAQAVALRDSLGLRGKVALEASGGITLEMVQAVAETGVDRISVGSITHAAAALDLSLERV